MAESRLLTVTLEEKRSMKLLVELPLPELPE